MYIIMEIKHPLSLLFPT